MKSWVISGSILAMLAVALGAFGAHGLEGRIEEKLLAAYKTGVQYHMYHALGLIAVALLFDKLRSTSLAKWSGMLMVAGIVLFSGSLYAMALTGLTVLGAITPAGGVCFIAGWALLAAAALKQ